MLSERDIGIFLYDRFDNVKFVSHNFFFHIDDNNNEINCCVQDMEVESFMEYYNSGAQAIYLLRGRYGEVLCNQFDKQYIRAFVINLNKRYKLKR